MNPNRTFASSTERFPHRCLVRLRGIYDSLKTAERRAADHLLAQPQNVAATWVVEFAAQAGCSEATVVRLAKRLGYAGYPGLRGAFAGVSPETPYRNIGIKDQPDAVLKKVFANSVQALQDTLAAIALAQFRAAVEALANARSLAFFGLGNAAVVAREAYHKFLRAGVSCHTAEDPDLQLIILSSHLGPGDVLIAISYSGESRPIVAVARAARARKVQVLAITNFPRSSLARAADIVLLTAVFQEHLNGEIGSQRLAQLAVLESLYVNCLLRQDPRRRKRLAAADRLLDLSKTRKPNLRKITKGHQP